MHQSQILSCRVRKDKRPILLLSIHSKPVVLEGEVVPSVLQRNGKDRPMIHTSLMHLKYTTSLYNVVVADHLQSNYSSH